MKDKPVFWKQTNGVLISVDDMDINHLRNVLKMIIRNNQKVQTVKPKDSFKLNGDMANEFNDSYPADDSFDFNDLPESMDIGNNELGCY